MSGLSRRTLTPRAERMLTNAEFEFTRLRVLAEHTADQMLTVPRDTAVILVLEAFMEVRRRAKDELMSQVLSPVLKGLVELLQPHEH
jgi:hypothetical protein